MKLLPDECLPVDFRHLVTGHDVITVSYRGWTGIKNGRLLALAAADGFDALVTTEGSIPFQQNPSSLPIAVVILEADSNDLSDLRPLAPALLHALNGLNPRTITRVR